jgi:hypothetical protein
MRCEAERHGTETSNLRFVCNSCPLRATASALCCLLHWRPVLLPPLVEGGA